MKEEYLREEHVIQEEIRDLSKYLDGIPESLRAGGAFKSYEKKLRLLMEELAVVRLQKLIDQPLVAFLDAGVSGEWKSLPDLVSLRAIQEQVRDVEKRHHNTVKLYSRISTTFSISILLAFAVVVADAYALPLTVVFPSSIIGMALAAMQTILKGILRKEQKTVDYLHAIRYEVEYLASRRGRHELISSELDQSVKRLLELLLKDYPDILQTDGERG